MAWPVHRCIQFIADAVMPPTLDSGVLLSYCFIWSQRDSDPAPYAARPEKARASFVASGSIPYAAALTRHPR